MSKSSSVADSPGDPFNTHGRPTMRAGLDLKDRLTSNLTLDATFNPDFGQVEVDPAVLNLSAFETFFPEKRPFFVEGSQVFDFGSSGCNFCSNVGGDERVLLAPHRARADRRRPRDGANRVRRRARRDDDLGAGKITGRTSSGYTIGLLDAVTGQANARVETPTGATSDAGGRAARELLRRARQARLTTTGISSSAAWRAASQRNIDTHVRAAAGAARRDVRQRSRVHVGRADVRAPGVGVGHQRVGRPARDPAATAVERAISSSAPIAARGRADFSRIGSTRTRRRCAAPDSTRASSKETGDWFGELQTNIRTPGYETNDYAFQQRADYIWFNGNIGRVWTKPTNWYRQIYTIAGGQDQRNFEGDRTQQQLHAYFSETTPQFWNVTVFDIHRPSVIDDKAAARRPGGDRADAATTRRSTSRPTRGTKLIGNAEPQPLLGRVGRLEPRRVGERDLSAGVEREHVVRTVVEPVAHADAVRRRVSGQHRQSILRNAVRDVHA